MFHNQLFGKTCLSVLCKKIDLNAAKFYRCDKMRGYNILLHWRRDRSLSVSDKNIATPFLLIRNMRNKRGPWYNVLFVSQFKYNTKARFPLPELTARVDGWPVSITRQHGLCLTQPVSTSRVDGPSTRLVETVCSSTRPVLTGNGNRALSFVLGLNFNFLFPSMLLYMYSESCFSMWCNFSIVYAFR